MNWKEGSFLKVAVLVLVTLNIGLIVNQWIGAKPIDLENGNRKPAELLVLEVGFDDGQKKEFQKLIRDHEEESRELKREIADMRKEFFGLLKDEKPEDYEKIKKKLGRLQEREMASLYKHFKEVRTLCKSEEQRELFDKVIGRSIPGPDGRPPRPHHGPRGSGGPPPPR